MNTEKTRVLVVDDEPAMRAMAKAMLESMGYETVLANSGEQSVDLYHQSLLGDDDTITMAIMDLTLPGGMSGVEALQEIQEMDADFPVVASSGYLEDNAYEICQQIGFVGVLPKPYTADKLKQLVEWVVSRKGIPGGYSEGMPQPEKKPEKKRVSPGESGTNAEAKSGNPNGHSNATESQGGHGLEKEGREREMSYPQTEPAYGRPVAEETSESSRINRSEAGFETNPEADRLDERAEVAVSVHGSEGD